MVGNEMGMTEAAVSFESVEALDEELSRVARNAGSLRLGLGDGLERLARNGGHHELGFSSIEAYALERCERSARWVQTSRALARRLEELPGVRRALAAGRVSFCMAQVIARLATAGDENVWLAEARTRTVRQMRALVREREREQVSPESLSDAEHSRALLAPLRCSLALGASGSGGGCLPSPPPEADVVVDVAEMRGSFEEERGTLTVTVEREETWLFECARMIVRHVGGATLEDTLEALVGEGTTALLSEISRDRLPELDEGPRDVAQRSWEAQLAAWRDEAEARCEARVLRVDSRHVRGEEQDWERRERDDDGETDEAVEQQREKPAVADVAGEPGADGDPGALDAELRRLADELARKDLTIGRLAEALWKADGWRRLGYATETQYARERLGCSLSSIKAKRALARRIRALPLLAGAFENHELGYEAARLAAVVAEPGTEAAWVARARERTVKHLREEVDAARMLGRLSGRRSMLPPGDETMKQIAAMESRIVSGEAFRDGGVGHVFAGGTGLSSANGAALRGEAFQDEGAGQMSADGRGRPSMDGDALRGEGPPDGGAGQMSADRPVRASLHSEAFRDTRSVSADGAASRSMVGQMSADLAVLADLDPDASASPDGGAEAHDGSAGIRGRVTLRFRAGLGLIRYYRSLDEVFRRHRSRTSSFFEFLCTSLIDSWRGTLGTRVEYARICARDRFRCTSPVCTRRDVTPHHLRFRSHGGDDSDENVASLCVWCHLEGIHGGRLAVRPPASDTEWTIGSPGHTVVHGRVRAAASTRA